MLLTHRNPEARAQVKQPEPVKTYSISGCTNKHRYPDLVSAHAAGDHMAKLMNSPEVYLYLCPCCGGYHLTKMKLAPDGKPNRWVYFFGKE